MIQPLVQELYQLLVFGFGSLLAKPRIRLDRNLFCEDDPIICSGVIALFVFSVLVPWWPSQNKIGLKLGLVGHVT
jgi:hypothetical protein